MVAQRLTQITPPAATPDQLWQRVGAAWSVVPQEDIQSHFESMPRRVAAGLGSNPGEGMEVYKYIVSLRHMGTLNSRRASSPLVKSEEEEERWEALITSMVFPLKIEWKRAKSYFHLYGSESYDWRTSGPLPRRISWASI
ncbi:hypothetical protein TNCV_631521 [Trichonephila clavipes]|nr:hypothetical protein TNCV_631521 [Trichonephila clavipes]